MRRVLTGCETVQAKGEGQKKDVLCNANVQRDINLNQCDNLHSQCESV